MTRNPISHPVTLRLADGDEYEVSKLEARLLEQIGERIYQRRLAAVQKHFANDPQKLYDAEMFTPGLGDIMAHGSTIRGMVEALTICVLDRNPEMGEERAAQLCGSLGVKEIIDCFDLIKSWPTRTPDGGKDAGKEAEQNSGNPVSPQALPAA